MANRSDKVTCHDDTQSFTIQLPYRLAERAEKYAKETANSITGVVIEALDALMRGRNVDRPGSCLVTKQQIPLKYR